MGLLGSLLEPLGTLSGALGGSGCDILAILGALDRILEPLGTLLEAFWWYLGIVLELFWSLESIFEAICRNYEKSSKTL